MYGAKSAMGKLLW